MDRHDGGDGDGSHAFVRRDEARIIFLRHDRRQISGLKTGQVFDIQEMNLVLVANLVESPRWLAADIDERIQLAALEPLDGFFMVEIKRVDRESVGIENGFGCNRHTAVLRAKAHPAPRQILQTQELHPR